MHQLETEFVISKGLPIPRSEQETIITHDKDADEWHFYSDNPVHCKRWEQAIIPSDKYPSLKVYHEETGQLIKIDGKINGTASINKKRVMTEEQKEQSRKNIMAYHEQNRF